MCPELYILRLANDNGRLLFLFSFLGFSEKIRTSQLI